MRPQLRIRQRRTEDCIPDPHNARIHGDMQIRQIADSITEFGFNNPILMHGDKVVAGHGRLEAAKMLGMEKVPTISLDHLTDIQRRAYVLADNKLAENASWSDDLLRLEISELLELSDVDIYQTGFSMEEISSLLDTPMFKPGTAEEQGKLDQLDPVLVNCPHCGKEFDLREND